MSELGDWRRSKDGSARPYRKIVTKEQPRNFMEEFDKFLDGGSFADFFKHVGKERRHKVSGLVADHISRPGSRTVRRIETGYPEGHDPYVWGYGNG